MLIVFECRVQILYISIFDTVWIGRHFFLYIVFYSALTARHSEMRGDQSEGLLNLDVP
jgi:hypothetical protein